METRNKLYDAISCILNHILSNFVINNDIVYILRHTSRRYVYLFVNSAVYKCFIPFKRSPRDLDVQDGCIHMLLVDNQGYPYI